MRRSRLVGAFLLVALLGSGIPPAAGQADPDWESLGYFRHHYGGWMRIWTNENTFDRGVRKINGDMSIFGNPYPGSTPEEHSTEFQVLWDETCEPKKAQTFRTERQIYLPGMPEKLLASLGAYSSSLPSGKKSPIKRVELLVNGTPVHEVKASKTASIPWAASERTIADIRGVPLRYGLNTFTVIGHKNKTKKSLGWCTGDNWFGVLAEVYGEFLADAVATHISSPGSGEAFPFDVIVSQSGPSDLYRSINHSFSVSAVSGVAQVSGIEVFNVAGCSAPVPVTGSKSGYALSCPLPHMIPGDSFTADVIVRFSNAPVGATTDITYRVQGYGEYDAAEQANNGQTFTVTTVEE